MRPMVELCAGSTGPCAGKADPCSDTIRITSAFCTYCRPWRRYRRAVDDDTHERAELTGTTDREGGTLRTDAHPRTTGPHVGTHLAPDSGETFGPDETTVCARCGVVAEGAPATWTCSVENSTRRYFCDTCARTHLRAIESRLDSAWW